MDIKKTSNQNKEICDMLLEIGEYERNINRNIFKYEAYKKAANILENYPTKIKSGKEASKLKGIGAKISKKIDEYLETGQLNKIEKIRSDDRTQIINLLTGVTGIGPVNAQKLADQGITTIEQLKDHVHELTHHQQIGLKYYDDFNQKIPRDEIKQIEEILRENVTKLDPNFALTICGSYRRGKSESSDIDVLITHPSYVNEKKRKRDKLLENIVNSLESRKLITDTLSLGDTKFMGACRLNEKSITRRIDIRLLPKDQYFCGILYFTGSDMFNKNMRHHALEKGYTLNEYYLRPIGFTGVPGEPVPITCEEDIFDYIDYPFKKPEERNI